MLPDGFRWETCSTDWLRVWAGDRIVASVTVVPNGSARVALHVDNSTRLRYTFRPDLALGVAYVERWAELWAERILDAS